MIVLGLLISRVLC